MLRMRYLPYFAFLAAIPAGVALGRLAPFWGGALVGLGVLGGLVGSFDILQRKRAVLRNYPVLARARFLLEGIRPEIRQYFLESDHDEVPFSREQRALVYRRAKGIEGLRPFGALRNQSEIGHEWINHSVKPVHNDDTDYRVTFGEGTCAQPYAASVLNISAMSFGALSPNAIEALNIGASRGGFAHTTGEGSISRYHRKHGGDLIWQVASGYFGSRDGGVCSLSLTYL